MHANCIFLYSYKVTNNEYIVRNFVANSKFEQNLKILLITV